MEVTSEFEMRGSGYKVPGMVMPSREMLVAQGLPPRAAVVARGRSHYVITATAAAAVELIPTTTAMLELQNLCSDGRHVSIRRVFAVEVANTAAVQAVGLLLCVGFAAKAAIAATLAPYPLLAGAPASKCRAAVGTTIAAGDGGVAANWIPWGASSATTTTQIGQTFEAMVDGGILLPQGFSLGVVILAGTDTASAFQIGVEWDEVEI